MPVSKKRSDAPRARRGPGGPRGRPTCERDGPSPAEVLAPSRRVTVAPARFRIRPGWHKVLGIIFIVSGIAVAVVNDVPVNGEAGLLPGGPSEGYLLLGVAIAGYGTWWLGLFDRPQNPRPRS